MSSKSPRQVRQATDQDGETIALIPLANHWEPAKILWEDFETLRAEGYSDQWTFNSNGQGSSYVRCRAGHIRGFLATVARLVMQPPKGYRVTYRGGNRLNLRRDNLTLEKGARPKKASS